MPIRWIGGGARRFFSGDASSQSLLAAVESLEKQVFSGRESYPQLLQWCGREKRFDLAKRIHSHLTRSGFRNDVFLGNLVIQMFTRCSSIPSARRVFDSMPLKSAFTWNIMIAAYAQIGHFTEAFAVFDRMWEIGVRPVHRPVLTLLVKGTRSLEELRELHARIEFESSSDAILTTQLIKSYAGFGHPERAAGVFERFTGKRDVTCWTALISAFAQNWRGREALETFKRMDSPPDEVSFVSAIDACSVLGDLREGQLLHRKVAQEGFKCRVLATSLVTFYGRCGEIELARRVFDEHRDVSPDIISWNAMISAYAQNGHHLQAIDIFEKMDVAPNGKTYSAVLDACAHVGALEKGRIIHSGIDPKCLFSDSFVATALVNMYGRCGLVEEASNVFQFIPVKDSVAWTAVISAFAYNGCCWEALDMFWEMIEEQNLQPDWVTFVGVLSACSYGGLTEHALKHFAMMCWEYDIRPVTEHFGCIIDLLGRTGQLDEAEEVMNSIRPQLNEVIWTTFLNACRIHGDVDRGAVAAEALFKLQPGNAEPYITLASIYSSAGREDDAKKVKARLVRKVARKKGSGSRSLIEVGDIVHAFGTGISPENHPRFGEMMVELEKLEMIHNGQLRWEDDPEGDEDHSERLALALGLITSSSSHESLHIVKNERMCDACHTGFKLVSSGLSEVKVITLRDTRRLHRFEDGRCSCGDYW